jgi:hypothetical protein
MRSIFFIIIIFSSWALKAQEVLPNGCLPLVVKTDSVTLSSEKYPLILVHNISDSVLWITHPAGSEGESGWSSRLQPGKWSVLVLNNSPIKFSCIESKPGHEQQASCRDVLAICQWPKAKVPEKKSGIFWAAEDMGMLPLKAYIGRLGFTLT